MPFFCFCCFVLAEQQIRPAGATEYSNVKDRFFSFCLASFKVLTPCTPTNHFIHFSCFSFLVPLNRKPRWLHVALVNPFHEGLRVYTVHWT